LPRLKKGQNNRQAQDQKEGNSTAQGNTGKQKERGKVNRRNFLKLLGIAPVAPSVLAALPKKETLRDILGHRLTKEEWEVGAQYITWTVESADGGIEDWGIQWYCWDGDAWKTIPIEDIYVESAKRNP